MEEEHAINIMLDRVADVCAEHDENRDADAPECGAEREVAERPAVVERLEHEQQLRDEVDERADDREEDVEDEEREWLHVGEPGDRLEGRDGDEEGEPEHGKAGAA